MSLPSILAIALLSGPVVPLVPPASAVVSLMSTGVGAPLLAQADGGNRDRSPSLRRLVLWGGIGAVGLGSLGAGVWFTLGALRKRGDRGFEDDEDDALIEDGDDGGAGEELGELGELQELGDAWDHAPPPEPPKAKPEPKAKAKPAKSAKVPKVLAKPLKSAPKGAAPSPTSPEATAIAASVPSAASSSAAAAATTLTTRVIQPSAFDRLVDDLHDRNATTRRRAIWQLGQMGDSRAIEPLLELTLDGDSKQRSLVMAALSEIGARTVKPMGRAAAMALQDDNPEVRMNAIRDLAQLCDRLADLSRVLAYATEDPDPEVKKTAQWAVKRLSAIRSLSDRQLAAGPPTGADAIASLSMAGDAGDRWLDQAQALLDANQAPEAEQLLDEALRYEPSSPDGHRLLAQVRRSLGKLGSAIAAELMARDLYVSQGNLSAARALEASWADQNLDPDEAAVQAASGVRLFSQGNYADAHAAIETAIALNPHAPTHHAILGRLLRQQGKLAEALQALTQARDLYVEQGNLPEARKMQQILRQLG
jgi:tetratricopeptide (TPR) repeat protein